jgi:hypothetical protein
MIWYRNTFWWVVLCVAFVVIYWAIDRWFDYDARFMCGYAFAQLYYQYVKKEE